ncbi:MAG: hypothetical protein K0R66_1741 [Gammaproteobacteria bacterium]|jgi:hypothetical protein|nr:hypothetical protein [Gammaproteobacteria bacterium]MDF2941099.1 hypothetical protein [Gammaproteobacteria bacterium]
MPISHNLLATNRIGLSPLSTAASAGDINLLKQYFPSLQKELSEQRFQEIITNRDQYGRSLAHHAAALGHSEAVLFILQCIDADKRPQLISIPDNAGHSVLEYGILYGSAKALYELLKMVDAKTEVEDMAEWVMPEPPPLLSFALSLKDRREILAAWVNLFDTGKDQQAFINNLPCAPAEKEAILEVHQRLFVPEWVVVFYGSAGSKQSNLESVLSGDN